MSAAGMGGAGAGPDEERDLLAGEYVLGTLDAAEARAVADQAQQDVALAAAIAAWQARLAPLAGMAKPVVPPVAVWSRIADSTGLKQASQAPTSSRWAFWNDAVLWRWTAGASLAAAVALLVFALLRPAAAPPHVAALLPSGQAAAGFLAEETQDGTLRLDAVGPVTVAAGKDLELWALAPGAARPVSLGVIPAVAQRFVVP
ncbi:MAG TPA: anti-sigma factor, partial [Acetobacteraceae bacterium]